MCYQHQYMYFHSAITQFFAHVVSFSFYTIASHAHVHFKGLTLQLGEILALLIYSFWYWLLIISWKINDFRLTTVIKFLLYTFCMAMQIRQFDDKLERNKRDNQRSMTSDPNKVWTWQSFTIRNQQQDKYEWGWSFKDYLICIYLLKISVSFSYS